MKRFFMLTLLVASLSATAQKEVKLNEVIVKGARTVEPSIPSATIHVATRPRCSTATSIKK